ncbi:uncharacterized protein [Amphiura filiformis]|uniref:uncharacterized protein isoform X2 n=1 Tax=Amphiura filiformis TaxID=82378 RepID=UPI003B216EF5
MTGSGWYKHQTGFLPLPNLFKPEELDPVREGVAKEVDRLANKLYDAGKIKDKHEDAGLFERLTLIENDFPGASVLLHKAGNLPVVFQKLWTNERLMNIMEQLIGPDIAGHPVWNLRCKTPRNEQATVPWHQDNAYLDPSSQEVLQPTAWIPLLDVNEHNGCLQVARGGHRTGKLAKHVCCVGGTWYVELSEEDMVKTLEVDIKKDLVTCDLPYGGVLLMNNLIPHCSLENYSDKIRWSFDLRYQTPHKSAGFHGVKEHVLFRTKEDPKHVIDWEGFNKTHRTREQMKESETSWHTKEDDFEFNTTISGPWMSRWELVHHNRHTAELKKSAESWTKA